MLPVQYAGISMAGLSSASEAFSPLAPEDVSLPEAVEQYKRAESYRASAPSLGLAAGVGLALFTFWPRRR